jgi:hypothetical protein
MRQKTPLAIAVVLLLAVGVAAVAAGSAAAPSASRQRGWAKPSAERRRGHRRAEAAAKRATRLVLIVRPVDFREFDLPPVGEFSPGDTVVFTEDAFTPGGRRVGHDQVRFTAMFREQDFVEAAFVLQGRGRSWSRASWASPSSGRPLRWLAGPASSATPAAKCSSCLGRPRKRPGSSSPCSCSPAASPLSAREWPWRHPAPPWPARSEHAPDEVRVIRLFARTVQDTTIDVGPTGESIGDQFVAGRCGSRPCPAARWQAATASASRRATWGRASSSSRRVPARAR